MNGLITGLSVDGILLAVLSPALYGLICIKANRASFAPTLISAFIVGFTISYAAYIVELLLSQGTLFKSEQQAWLYFTALVAFPEETVKLAALIGLTHNQVHQNRATLIISCFIGCGFAASENVTYLKQFGESVIAPRFLTATAFHVFNAVIMGRLLINKTVQERALSICYALLFPVILHGTYDYLIIRSSQNGGQFVFILGFAAAAGIVTLRTFPMRSP